MKEFLPKPYKKGSATIYIDFNLLETIDRLAGKCDLSRSEFIRQSLSFALAHMPHSEKPAAKK